MTHLRARTAGFLPRCAATTAFACVVAALFRRIVPGAFVLAADEPWVRFTDFDGFTLPALAAAENATASAVKMAIKIRCVLLNAISGVCNDPRGMLKIIWILQDACQQNVQKPPIFFGLAMLAHIQSRPQHADGILPG
ncbi:MAG: hypothetical protein ABIO49_09110 [Dokdonella sp.]